MAAIEFNIDLFRAQVPAMSGAEYSDAMIQVFWDIATEFADRDGCGCLLSLNSRAFLLNLLTAHLIQLSKNAEEGDSGGFVQSATIDKVYVARLMPPIGSALDWWLMQTPFGQQIRALLEISTAGGCTFGGRPEISAFRRAGGW